VAEAGFSLHAATRAGERARLALVKYILRPPIANERLELRPDDLVRIVLKKPFADGTFAIDMDRLSLLSPLAASVRPPHFHTIRYAGALAARASLRPLIVPPPKAESEPPPAQTQTCQPGGPGTHRCRFVPWALLLKRTFAIDVEHSPHCGGRMKLLALITDPDSIAAYLACLGEPTQPPPLSPARAPPYWKTTVLRRKWRHHDTSVDEVA
jgi:hypothetical protein